MMLTVSLLSDMENYIFKTIFLHVKQEMPTYRILNREVNIYGHRRDGLLKVLII